MAARDILLDSLRMAARRVRHQRWVRDAAWGAAALLSIFAVGIVVERAAGVPAVAVSIRALLIVCAIAVAVAVGVRGCLRPPLPEVAAGVDAVAGLHDELLSAYWFATLGTVSSFAEAHVQRAATRAKGLAWSQLFPLAMPRRAVMVAVSAVVVAGIAWSMPVPRASTSGDTGEVGATGRTVSSRVGGSTPRQGVDDEAAAAPGAASDRQRMASDVWKQIEALAGALSQRPEGKSLAQAIAARDARAAAEALRAAKGDRSAPVSGAGAADGPGEQMTDVLAQGILDRLASLLNAESPAPTGRDAGSEDAERPTARLDRELRADQDDAQPGVKREQSAGEDALNTSLRALSRRGTAGRDMVHGEADATEGAGRANVGGGAMGRRVGVSTGGAGDGDQPVGNLVAPEQGDQVLGRRTERLAVQLKAVKVPETAAGEADNAPTGTEESFFAATRAQVSRIGFRAAGGSSRNDAEGVAGATDPPAGHRDAVKRYTLVRHRRDADARAAEEAR